MNSVNRIQKQVTGVRCFPPFAKFPVPLPDVSIDIFMVGRNLVAKYLKVGKMHAHVGRLKVVHISHSN
jgi:hypothetical protein